MVESLAGDGEAIFFPIGKKANEYYRHRNREILTGEFPLTAEVGVGEALSAAERICIGYLKGEFTRVVLAYTRFASMLSQIPVYEELLPLSPDIRGESIEPLLEEEPEEILEKLIPGYIGGIIYSAVAEAVASESGARRSAMNAANKNAEEMIGTLMLKYNRARQAVITQEITEIVSGSEAL